MQDLGPEGANSSPHRWGHSGYLQDPRLGATN
jgi:hypothetical protein